MHYFFKVIGWLLLLACAQVNANQGGLLQENTVVENENNPLIFSEQELSWIADNKEVTVIGDTTWFPFEGFDRNGQYVGIVAEVLKKISAKSGLVFDVSETATWRHTMQFANDRQVDIISASASNPILEKNYRATFSTIKNPIVMVARNNMDYIPELSAENRLRVALLADSGYSNQVKQAYPAIDFIEVDEISDGLLGVADERYDLILMSMAVASYQMSELGLYELRVVGVTDIEMALTLFVNRNKPLLWEIINKVKLHESKQEQHEILSKWIRHKYIDRYSPKIVCSFILIVLFVVIFVFYRNYLLKKQAKVLTLLAQTDPLTNIKNRLSLDQMMRQQISESQRYKTEFSLIMIDIDLFKPVNDKYGHLVGDKLLQQFVLLLQESIRQSDLLGRWGGEEFLIICPHTNLAQAAILAEKLRVAVFTAIFLTVGKKTASFGVAQYHPSESAECCLARADEAMYRAKSSGGNQVKFEK